MYDTGFFFDPFDIKNRLYQQTKQANVTGDHIRPSPLTAPLTRKCKDLTPVHPGSSRSSLVVGLSQQQGHALTHREMKRI